MNIDEYRRLHEAVTEARDLSDSDIITLPAEAIAHLIDGTTPPVVFEVEGSSGALIVNYDTGQTIETFGDYEPDTIDVAFLKETFGDLFRPWRAYDVLLMPSEGSDPWPSLRDYAAEGDDAWSQAIRAKAPKQPLKLTLKPLGNSTMEARDQNDVLYAIFYGDNYDLHQAAMSAISAFEDDINNPDADDETLYRVNGEIMTRRQAHPYVLKGATLEPVPEVKYVVDIYDGYYTYRREAMAANEDLAAQKALAQVPSAIRYRVTRPTEFKFGQHFYAGTTELAQPQNAEWRDVA